ncbi:MAG: GIY-YIG nuclease family protein [Sphingomonadaceae bacterium]
MEFDVAAFLAEAAPPSKAPTIASPGIYAILLANPDALPALTAGRGGILYLGMTNDGLDARNHFHHAHSGFSTFRRSLGALLKGGLGLHPIPRAPGKSRSNVVNYRFPDEEERALSQWMQANLQIAQLALKGDIATTEKDAIRLLEPPLNLTGWPNPQRAMLKGLRADCVTQAELARGPSK